MRLLSSTGQELPPHPHERFEVVLVLHKKKEEFPMKTIHISTLVLTSIVLATGLFAQAQPHSHAHSDQTPVSQSKQAKPKPGMMDAKMMMAQCKEMMQKKEQMQSDMNTMDAKLDGLVATMNAATGSDKADATAAVVSELVMQRKVQRDKMAAMQSDMMQHMMQHMQMGKKSMMMCPMMKGM
jgi:hypothetical protein